jgi:MFS family permease
VSALALLKHKNMILCALISVVMVSWMVLGWTFLPIFYPEARQISSSNASLLMSVLGVSATLGAFLVPGLSDRFGRKPVMIGFAFMGMLTPLAALYFDGPLWTLAVFLFIGWLASGIFPLFMATIPSETVPPTLIATAAGLAMGLGEVFGGFGSPIIAGRAADVYGVAAPLYIMTGLCFVAGVLSLFLTETAPVKKAALAPSPA